MEFHQKEIHVKSFPMKILYYLLPFIIIGCSSSNSKTSITNSYEIINIFTDEYSYDSFSNKTRKFYLNEKVEYTFSKECLSSYRDALARFKVTDSLCKSGNFPIIDSVGKSMPCIMRGNYTKYVDILSTEDLNYFLNKNFSKNISFKLEKNKIKNPSTIVVDTILNYDNKGAIYEMIYLKGPFYNKNKNIAFLEWYRQDLISNWGGSSNCILFKKIDGKWSKVGNLNYGL